MSITAIVENDIIRLPVHVPDGTSVEVLLTGESNTAATRQRADAGIADYRQRVAGGADFAAMLFKAVS